MIGICEICRYGQTEKCTRPSGNSTRDCFESYMGTSVAEKKIVNETIDKCEERLNREMCDLWNWYSKDKKNRPKPKFVTAIAMVELIFKRIREELDEQ